MIFSNIPYELNEMILKYLNFQDLIHLKKSLPDHRIENLIRKKYINGDYTLSYALRVKSIDTMRWLLEYYDTTKIYIENELMEAYGYALVNPQCDRDILNLMFMHK